MEEQYQVTVFGKEGCEKCKALNKRLDSILKKEEWRHFRKNYLDVHTEEGLLAFSKAECINPQRIPALLVQKRNPETGDYEPVPNPKRVGEDKVCGDSRLYTHLGLQTDYSQKGKGLISPKMIKQVLQEAAT